jgi:UDP-glucose 4,6-dehydratase
LIKKKCDYGIYNVVNTDPINTKQVAELLKEYKLIDSYDILNEEEFYKNVDVKAPRSNCILDNSKLINTGFEIRNSIDAIRNSLENWKK